MGALALVAGGAVGLVVGVVGGIYLGRWSAPRAAWWFWLIAFAVILAGIGIAFLGARAHSDAVFAAGIAVIAGGLTALKYSAGKIPGMGGEV